MADKPKTEPQNLPIFIGSLGGINPGGRSGNFKSYGFMVREQLDCKERAAIIVHQARLMNLIRWSEKGWVDANHNVLTESDLAAKWDPILNERCFIRRPDKDRYFDPYASKVHRRCMVEEGEILWPRRTLPEPLPESWQVVGEDPERRMVRLRISKETEVFMPSTERLEVSCGGTIPDGVSLESSGFGTKAEKIPHAVKLALFGANDAMKSLGVSFDVISQTVPQSEMGLYIGSAMSQLDHQGLGGYMQSCLLDQRVSSTSLPFSLSNMAADFVAAYCLGSLGHISCDVGACATFLFNLYNACRDIRQGKMKFALVGVSDGPIQPWVFQAYHVMKALGRDEPLRSARGMKKFKDALGNEFEDLPRSEASIPFGDNFGFTLSEGSQFLTLFHPDLAKELGVNPIGAVGEVFCNSDGWKKSISKPGIGNYLTFGRALASVEKDLGTHALKQRSFISAHGSSTPQNRRTESEMFSRFAKVFELNQIPVTAVKSWFGHTLGAAAGDQIACALGAFHYNIINPIRNLDRIADDVHQENLHFCQTPYDISKNAKDGKMDCCIVNSKGFGGHNATGLIYSQGVAQNWLDQSMNSQEQSKYKAKKEDVTNKQEQWEKEYLQGSEMINYSTDHSYDEGDIEELSRDGIKIRNLKPKIQFG